MAAPIRKNISREEFDKRLDEFNERRQKELQHQKEEQARVGQLITHYEQTLDEIEARFSTEALEEEEEDAGRAWGAGISQAWKAELLDPREDIYTLQDGVPSYECDANSGQIGLVLHDGTNSFAVEPSAVWPSDRKRLQTRFGVRRTHGATPSGEGIDSVVIWQNGFALNLQRTPFLSAPVKTQLVQA